MRWAAPPHPAGRRRRQLPAPGPPPATRERHDQRDHFVRPVTGAPDLLRRRRRRVPAGRRCHSSLAAPLPARAARRSTRWASSSGRPAWPRARSRRSPSAPLIDLAISMVDLTTLEGADTAGKVRGLARKAVRPDPDHPDTPSAAAVCVYPDLVPAAVEALAGTGVKVASVATAFPAGRSSLEVKLADTRLAVDGRRRRDRHGDRPRRLPRRGLPARATTRSCAVKQACGAARLKVILETGELATYDNVRRASLAGPARRAPTSSRPRPARSRPPQRCPSPRSCCRRSGTGAASDRRAARGQAGRRHPHHQGRDPLPGARPRGRRPRVARPALVPLRRLLRAERPRHAAAHAAGRSLLRSATTSRSTERPLHMITLDYAAAPEAAVHRPRPGAAT